MLAAALFLTVFVFYLASACGTIPSYRDSGDFISALPTLGIPHPPGYPLYTIVGKFWLMSVPWGNAAYRVNALSALAAAASVSLIYIAIKQRLQGLSNATFVTAMACLAALSLGLTPAVRSLAGVAEMYTASLFCAAALLFLLGKEERRFVRAGTLLWGLSLGIHPTLIFLAPFVGQAIFRSWANHERRYAALELAGLFILGFSIVLYLPLRAHAHPLLDWGRPTTARYFWRVLTRADYGGLRLHPEQSQFSWSAGDVGIQLGAFAQAMRDQFGACGVMLGLLGCYCALRRLKNDRWPIVVTFLIAGPGFFLLANLPWNEPTTAAILEPYLLLTNLFWVFFIAFAAELMGGFSQRIEVKAVLILVLAVGVCAQYSQAAPSRRHDTVAYDYGRNLLRSLPKGAVLFDPDDSTAFTLSSLQLTEKRRQDIIALNFFRTRWGYEQVRERFPSLLPGYPISSAQELEQYWWTVVAPAQSFYGELPQKFPSGIPYTVQGLTYRAGGRGNVQDFVQAEAMFNFLISRGRLRASEYADFFSRHLVENYAAAENNLGLKYAEQKKWLQARRHYAKALVIQGNLSAAYNNLGIADYENGEYGAAIINYGMALRLSPGSTGIERNRALAEQAQRSKPLHPGQT